MRPDNTEQSWPRILTRPDETGCHQSRHEARRRAHHKLPRPPCARQLTSLVAAEIEPRHSSREPGQWAAIPDSHRQSASKRRLHQHPRPNSHPRTHAGMSRTDEHVILVLVIERCAIGIPGRFLVVCACALEWDAGYVQQVHAGGHNHKRRYRVHGQALIFPLEDGQSPAGRVKR